MPGRRRRRHEVPGRKIHPVGVIDIGSNSIRLVIFDALSRVSHPLFNEKVLCGLGRGLERTGALNPDGIAPALDNLARFASLTKALHIRQMRVVATAAVRDAKDGAAFVQAVRRRTGLRVEILDGNEEARLSALGVIAGMPDAHGLMGDLGGGSLELVRISKGRVGEHETLPFGPLRLRENSDKGRGKLRDMIDAGLDRIGWTAKSADHPFYAVGGAWRAIARLHMAHTNYPLHVIHGYTIKRAKAEEFLDVIAGLSRESLERFTGAARRRLDALPLAALVLERILRRAKSSMLTFSALGLREGCLFDELPARVRRLDPLLSACEEVAHGGARFPIDGGALLDWATPILKDGSPKRRRLRLAACLVSDIAWSEHPDYRAEIAFLRILRMPLTGIDHPGRAYLALTAFTRYDGQAEGNVTRPAWLLLDEDELREAYRLGLALRLAYTFCGGATAALRRTTLRPSRGVLEFVIPRAQRSLVGEAVERRLDALARAFDRKPAIKIA